MSETMSVENLETKTKIEKEKSGFGFVNLMQESIPYIMDELGFERNKGSEEHNRLRNELKFIVMNLGKTVEETFHNSVIDERNKEEIRKGIHLAMSGGNTPDRFELKELSEDEIEKIEKIILRRLDEYMNLNV